MANKKLIDGLGKLLDNDIEEPESCCTCIHTYAKQELTQDRLDVDIVHYCKKREDRLYENEGKKGCKDYEYRNDFLGG